MADTPDRDQKTEQPTAKRVRESREKGDVLQSRELATALVVLAGAGWLSLMGPMMVESLERMLIGALRFDSGVIRNFDPSGTALNLAGEIAFPFVALFGVTLLAAIAAPALLGSLGFRWGAAGFRPEKLNPLSGVQRMFGMQGLIELAKSLAKIVLLGAVGWWLLTRFSDQLVSFGSKDIEGALGDAGDIFVTAVIVMAGALLLIALIDVPAQFIQRNARLRMSKQEIKDEHRQSEGSPELKAAIRRKQHEVLKGSARQALAEATVVLTNPTHFAVALRYDPGKDAAPVVVARGRGATADAIRELAEEAKVPMLRYPQLARAIYYTSRTGQVIRDDLYLAVATVIAFVFNLDSMLADGIAQPEVEVPDGARFDAEGRAE